MIRYDKSSVAQKENIAIQEEDQTKTKGGKRLVRIDKFKQHEITKLFLKELDLIKINGKKLVSRYNNDTIIINPDISLSEIKSELKDNSLKDYSEFVKNYYHFNFDKYVDLVFGESVISIHEIPFSINSSQQNPSVITFEFLV